MVNWSGFLPSPSPKQTARLDEGGRVPWSPLSCYVFPCLSCNGTLRVELRLGVSTGELCATLSMPKGDGKFLRAKRPSHLATSAKNSRNGLYLEDSNDVIMDASELCLVGYRHNDRLSRAAFPRCPSNRCQLAMPRSTKQVRHALMMCRAQAELISTPKGSYSRVISDHAMKHPFPDGG